MDKHEKFTPLPHGMPVFFDAELFAATLNKYAIPTD